MWPVLEKQKRRKNTINLSLQHTHFMPCLLRYKRSWLSRASLTIMLFFKNFTCHFFERNKRIVSQCILPSFEFVIFIQPEWLQKKAINPALSHNKLYILNGNNAKLTQQSRRQFEHFLMIIFFIQHKLC